MMRHHQSLQDVLSSKPDLVDHFYNDTLPRHAKTNSGITPVPPEFTNWVEEQRA